MCNILTKVFVVFQTVTHIRWEGRTGFPTVNRRKKDSPTSKARERQTPHSSVVVSRDDLRSHQVPQNDATSFQDTQGLDHAALASSVAQQIVP